MNPADSRVLWCSCCSRHCRRGAGRSEVADAVMKGDKAALRALLQQKADVNAPQVDGATALHWAVYRDDVEAADLLIRAGANVDAANRDEVTPLAMASLYGNAPMIDRLLKGGGDPKRRGRNGETAADARRAQRQSRRDQAPGRPPARTSTPGRLCGARPR